MVHEIQYPYPGIAVNIQYLFRPDPKWIDKFDTPPCRSVKKFT